MLDYVREGTTKEEMVHHLHRVVAQHTTLCVLQATTRKMLRSPATIVASEPHEELDPWGARPPDEPSRARSDRALEESIIATLGHVLRIRCPTPLGDVWVGSELGCADQSPNLDMLS